MKTKSTTETTETIYTPEEVADLLSVNIATVYRYIKSGKLKATRLGGNGQYRITLNNYNAFINA